MFRHEFTGTFQEQMKSKAESCSKFMCGVLTQLRSAGVISRGQHDASVGSSKHEKENRKLRIFRAKSRCCPVCCIFSRLNQRSRQIGVAVGRRLLCFLLL